MAQARQLTLVSPAEERTLPWFIPTPEKIAERDALLRAKYFIVNTRHGMGEVWKCTRCGGKHGYLTLMCIERPFSGITGGLFAYWQQYDPEVNTKFLSDTEVERYKAIHDYLRTTPSLQTMHPRLAATFRTDPGSIDLGGIALGILEPITAARAQRMLDDINAHGGKLTVPGLRA